MKRIWMVGVSVLLMLSGACKPAESPAQSGAAAPDRPAAPVKSADKPASEAPHPVLRWHSLGLSAVTNAPGGTRLKEVLALHSTAQMRAHVLGKLSTNLPSILCPEAGTNTQVAARVKPLVEDVLAFESKVIWASRSPLRWRVAVRIPEERTGVWTAGLHDLLVRGEYLEKIQKTNLTGRVVELNYSATEAYRYGINEGWVTVERAEPGYAWDKLAAAPFLTNEWLSLEMDGESLPWAASIFNPGNTPHLRLTMEAKGENQLSRLSLRFPQPLNLKLTSWRVPTNTIKDPVISFTAIRGIDGWWSRQNWLAPLALPETPSQAYIWAQEEVPFQTFAAFSVKGASNVVQSSLDKWTNDVTAAISNRLAGKIVNATNELRWTGLPIIVPGLRAAPEPQDDYLYVGVFPMSPNSTSLPPALVQQFINRSNILYYDWEITEGRLSHWKTFMPLLFMSANRLLVHNSREPYLWLADAGPKLGNTVTEAELTGPKEIKVLRNSPAGFSAIELHALSRWLDQKSFPRWDEDVAPAVMFPGAPGAPAAPGQLKK